MTDAPITSREFSREMDHVKGSLARIEDHLGKLNSKTATNTENIAVLQRDVAALIDEDLAIDKKVDTLSRDGCANYAAHTELLQQLAGVNAWTPQKKAAVAGTLVGTGVLAWPMLQAFLQALHQAVGK